MTDTSVKTKRCSNCKRDIAISNFFLHDAHCCKHIVLCDVCKEPVSRLEIEEHFQKQHAPVKCELCSSMLETDKIEEHKENDCPKRLVKCIYCNLEMPACDNDNHEEYCGSRTEPCTKCHRYIMYKDLKRHEQLGCSFPADDKDKNEHKSSSGSNTGKKNRTLNHVTNSSANNYVVDEITQMFSRTVMSGSHETPPPNNARFGNSCGRGIVLPKILRNTTTSIRPRLSSLKDTKNICRERENKDTGHHSNINHQNADWLLAQQMADMKYGEVEQVPFPSDNGSDDDHAILPCEYCHKTFSVDDFILHQTICKPEGVPAVNVYDDNMDNLENNNTGDTDSQRTQTNIVNDLSFEAAEDGLMDHEFSWLHQASELDDETLLPCEFCDDLFPCDILVQHQVLCNSSSRQGRQRESNQTRPRPRSRSRDQGPKNQSSNQSKQHKANNQLSGMSHSGYRGAPKARLVDALPTDRDRPSSGKKSSEAEGGSDILDDKQSNQDERARNHPNQHGLPASKQLQQTRPRVTKKPSNSWNSTGRTTHKFQDQGSQYLKYMSHSSNYRGGGRGHRGMQQRFRGGWNNRSREGTANHHYNIQDYSSQVGERGSTSNVSSAHSKRKNGDEAELSVTASKPTTNRTDFMRDTLDGPGSTNRQPAVSRGTRNRSSSRRNHDNSSENNPDSWGMRYDKVERPSYQN